MSDDRKLHQAEDPVPYYDDQEGDVGEDGRPSVLGVRIEDLLAPRDEPAVADTVPLAVRMALATGKPSEVRRALATGVVKGAKDVSVVARRLTDSAAENSELTSPLSGADTAGMVESVTNGVRVFEDVAKASESAKKNYYSLSLAMAGRKEVRELLRVMNDATMEMIDLAADSGVQLFGGEAVGTTLPRSQKIAKFLR